MDFKELEEFDKRQLISPANNRIAPGIKFRELLDFDNRQILNANEFAERVTVDGVYFRGQVQFSSAKRSSLEKENYDGLHGDFCELYIKTEDFELKHKPIPAQGNIIFVNK